jgi:hypothetical protein
MIRTCLFNLALACSFGVHAQIEVYKTVGDLKSNTPTTYPGYDFYSETGTGEKAKIVLRNNETKEKVEIEYIGIWGLSYKGDLYRIARKGIYYESDKAPENMAVKLVANKGGVLYWLNTPYQLSHAKKAAEQEAKGKVPDTFYFELDKYQGFLSNSVDGDLMLVLGGGTKYVGLPKWMSREAEHFMRDNPQLNWLKKCAMGKHWSYYGENYVHKVVMECIKEYVPSESD